jgi:hypothetical protein
MVRPRMTTARKSATTGRAASASTHQSPSTAEQ